MKLSQRTSSNFPKWFLLAIFVCSSGCNETGADIEKDQQEATSPRLVFTPVATIELGSLSAIIQPTNNGIRVFDNKLEIGKSAYEELLQLSNGNDQIAREALSAMASLIGRDTPIGTHIIERMCEYAHSGDLGEAWNRCVFSLLRSSSRKDIERAFQLIEYAAGFLDLSYLFRILSVRSDCTEDSPSCEFAKNRIRAFDERILRLAQISNIGSTLGRSLSTIDSAYRTSVAEFLAIPNPEDDIPLMSAWTLNAISIAGRIMEGDESEESIRLVDRVLEKVSKNISLIRTFNPTLGEHFHLLFRCQFFPSGECGLSINPSSEIRSPFTQLPGGLAFSTRCSEAQSRLVGFLEGQGAFLDRVGSHQLRCLWTGESGRQDPDLAIKLARLFFIAGNNPISPPGNSQLSIIEHGDFAGMLTFDESPMRSLSAALFILAVADGDPIAGETWGRAVPGRQQLSALLGPSTSRQIRQAADSWRASMEGFSGRTQERVLLGLLDYLGFLRFRLPGWDESSESPKQFLKSGSGFYVSSNIVLTSYHVVEGCKEVLLDNVGTSIFATDSATDLALLNAPERDAYLTISSDEISKGATVTAMGYPIQDLGSPNLVITSGSVSALTGPSGDSRLIQFTAPIQPGSSGGPILLASNEVAGVVTGTLLPMQLDNGSVFLSQNVNYAVRSETINTFLRSNEVIVGDSWFRQFNRPAPESAVVKLSCRPLDDK